MCPDSLRERHVRQRPRVVACVIRDRPPCQRRSPHRSSCQLCQHLSTLTLFQHFAPVAGSTMCPRREFVMPESTLRSRRGAVGKWMAWLPLRLLLVQVGLDSNLRFTWLPHPSAPREQAIRTSESFGFESHPAQLRHCPPPCNPSMASFRLHVPRLPHFLRRCVPHCHAISQLIHQAPDEVSRDGHVQFTHPTILNRTPFFSLSR